MADNTLLRIAKLNNNNYQTWKFKVELLLTKEELWNVVSDEPPDPVTQQWRSKDQKAKANIGLLLEDNQLHLVRKQTTAKGMWTALQSYHQKSTLSNKVNLLKKLCNLKLAEDGDMENHLSEMENLIDQLSSLGEPLAEHLSVALFLSSLPDSYGTLITALETRPEDDLTIELVKSKLIEEYKRRNGSITVSGTNDQKVLKIVKEPKKSPGTLGMLCYFCKKPNHMKKECRKYIEWKRKNPDHRAKTVVQNTDAHEEEVHGAMGISSPDICFGAREAHTDQNWLIDSGATSHMCGDMNFFTELDKERTGNIFLADGRELTYCGIGEGYVECIVKDSKQVVKLTDVLYVPQLHGMGNLISVKKLTNRGLEVNFKDNVCHIMKDGRIVAQASDSNGLYGLKVAPKVLMTTEGNGTDCIHAWHNRLGHRDPNAIRLLEGNLNITTCSQSLVCESCIQAKMTRKPVPKKSDSRSTNVLDLIHTDVCGPMQTTTPGGNKYFMTVIDDYSRYTMVYLLKNKAEVMPRLTEYVKYVQTKFGRTPKKIRSDRGGEYTSDNLRNFLKGEGIKMELTVPYTPEQNGCAERKNRYLVEMVRCMLTDSGLPNKYWGEAIMTANHMQNMLPACGDPVTPFEKWNDRKPNYSYIKRFGCTAFAVVHIRQKLDSKARKLVFVGYEEGTKGYRLLDVQTNRMHISKDVVFVEGDAHITPMSRQTSVNDTTNSQDAVVVKLETLPTVVTSVLLDEPDRELQEVEPRRSTRINKGVPPTRLIETANKTTTEITEPRTFQEAQISNETKQWSEAMNIEMESLRKNKTWTLTELPLGKTVIGSKWVYKAKSDEQGIITRYKARLVAQGYSQKYGDDYDEVFAPVAKPATLRILLTIAGKKKMVVKHYDIESAYLNGDLSHEVYMKQPEGYHQGSDNMVCKLEKNLYGLKQGANEWNRKLHSILTNEGYIQSRNDPCLYFKRQNDEWMYITIHVDDLIVASTDEQMIKSFEEQMNKTLVMKNLGNLQYYLGLQYERGEDGIFLVHQKHYIDKKLQQFNLSDCRPSQVPVDPGYQKRFSVSEKMRNPEIYRKAIGSLLYLATNSRPDIAIGTSILARKVSDPEQADWTEVKRIFRYLKYTRDLKLRLGDQSDQVNQKLVGYVDADWGSDVHDRKSNTGYFFKYLASPIVWTCRKQDLVSLSSTEAEYIALAEATQELLWIKRILEDFNQDTDEPTTVYEDNQSCIRMLESNSASQRTKHVDTKYHFIRDLYKLRHIAVKYLPSEHMTADLLTKPLGPQKIRLFTRQIGLI